MEKHKCEECGKVIEGFTKNQVEHNLKVHKLSKHKEEDFMDSLEKSLYQAKNTKTRWSEWI